MRQTSSGRRSFVTTRREKIRERLQDIQTPSTKSYHSYQTFWVRWDSLTSPQTKDRTEHASDCFRSVTISTKSMADTSLQILEAALAKWTAGPLPAISRHGMKLLLPDFSSPGRGFHGMMALLMALHPLSSSTDFRESFSICLMPAWSTTQEATLWTRASLMAGFVSSGPAEARSVILPIARASEKMRSSPALPRMSSTLGTR
mmetsp:Transcript_8663/g.24330  ORF Transcript_8663/g.24330 Transcript_8663/m.24330 type:complete len:203 (+) Transcript_8663:2564-3172(+)